MKGGIVSDFLENITNAAWRLAERMTELDFEDSGYAYQGGKYLTVHFGSQETGPLPADIGHKEAFGFNQQAKTLVKVRMNALDLPADIPKEGITLSEKDELFGKENGWKLVGAKQLGNAQLELWFES
jgi:hypothetical protein